MSGAPRAVFVCPVVPHPPQTGGQKRVLRLLEAALRAGVEPTVLTPDPAGRSQRAALEGRGCRLEVVDERGPTLAGRLQQHIARRPSPYLHRLAGRLRELAGQSPAWVQLEHGQSGYYLPELTHVRTVWSLHNLDSAMLRSFAVSEPRLLERARAEVRWRAMRTTERRLARRADAVLCVSADEEAALRELGARTVRAPNGVDDDLFDLSPERPPGEDVLFFGQLRYGPNRRGLLRFLEEGWPRVAAARPAAELRVVGEGADAELAAAVTAAQRATLVGLVPQIAAELARAAAVVVPVWEGAGTRLKVLEALAAARPVVGTRLGVAGIGFEDGRHGRVAETPHALGDALAVLLAAPREAGDALVRQGRALARQFRWGPALDPVESLYRRWAMESSAR